MSITISHVKSQYFYALSLKKLHPNVKKQRIYIVNSFYNIITNGKCIYLADIHFQHIHTYLLTLYRLKTSTYNLYLSHLKDFLVYTELYYEMHPLSVFLQRKSEDSKLPKNIPLSILLQLCQISPNEKSHLLSTKRNQAMMEFLVSTGVRSSELRSLRIRDLSSDLSECCISTTKGGNNRVVFLGIPAQDTLLNYFQARKINRQKDKNMYLFPGRKNQQMKVSAVSQAIKRLSQKRIGFGISPHMIRHSFATEMLRATGCLRSVQEMMGHININNTAKYCHLSYQDTLTAINKYHPHGTEYNRFPILEIDCT